MFSFSSVFKQFDSNKTAQAPRRWNFSSKMWLSTSRPSIVFNQLTYENQTVVVFGVWFWLVKMRRRQRQRQTNTSTILFVAATHRAPINSRTQHTNWYKYTHYIRFLFRSYCLNSLTIRSIFWDFFFTM